MIPTFRNEIEASIYAERFKPLKTALNTPVSFDYQRKYGGRVTNTVETCRNAARIGDMNLLSLYARSLSAILFHERPSLFETRERRAA